MTAVVTSNIPVSLFKVVRESYLSHYHPAMPAPLKPKVIIGKRWAGGLMRIKHNRATGIYEHMAPEITGDMELLQRCLCPARRPWIKDHQ
jgi:hypothetical protein